MNTAKQEHKTFGLIFPDYLSHIHLVIFKNIKCQWDFIMEKPVVQLWGCHDLNTTDREFVLKRLVIAYVIYSTQTGTTLNRGHYIKESHPFSQHDFIEIVNTTKVHRRI